MALPAQDGFTGTNGDALDVYSSNWTCHDADSYEDEVEIQSNGAAPADGGWDYGLQRWNADTFNDGQYAECKVVAPSTTARRIGPAVRIPTSGTAITGYVYLGHSTASYLMRLSAGVATQLGSNGSAWSANDVARIEADGTTITPKLNGSVDSSIGAQTDSAHSSGAAGLGAYADDTSAQVDDWEGGDLAAAAGDAFIPIMSRLRSARSILLRI